MNARKFVDGIFKAVGLFQYSIALSGVVMIMVTVLASGHQGMRIAPSGTSSVVQLAATVPAVATAADAPAHQRAAPVIWRTCTHRGILYDGHAPGYRIDDDAFAGYAGAYCIQSTTNHDFTTLNCAKPDTAGTVVAYPKIYVGVNYTSADPESNLALPVTDLGNLTLHVSSRGKPDTCPTERWQSDADLWFSRSAATASLHGDREMVVISRLSGGRHHTPRTCRIGGRWWYATVWRTGAGHWPLIYWVPSRGAVLLSARLPVAQMIRYAIRRGWMPRSQWLDQAGYGDEVWAGARGLTNSMTVTGMPSLPVIHAPGGNS